MNNRGGGSFGRGFNLGFGGGGGHGGGRRGQDKIFHDGFPPITATSREGVVSHLEMLPRKEETHIHNHLQRRI
jgi:hypothetical protein